MKKLVNESLLNEEISVEIDSNSSNFEDNLSQKKEEDAAKTFSWSPPTKAVTVTSLDANIGDDFNTDVNITMSNGDSIVYELFETRTPRNGQTVPPFYSFSLKINGNVVSTDLDEILGNTGTIVGDILLYYRQTVLEKKGK